MRTFNLRGMGVAIVTPFHQDKSIDFQSLSRLLDYIIDGNADYIVVLGTTGETPTLSLEERVQVREFTANYVKDRIPLVLGLGGNNTSNIIHTLKTEDLSKFSAILSVVPYYNKPTQEGIYQHYREIANASPLPVILYNIPGRTGVNMTAETTLRLANDCKNIVGVKEASGDKVQITAIIRQMPAGFQVVSGDDSNALELIENGASGVISVVGNAFPSLFGKMINLALQNKMEEAKTLNLKFKELFSLLFVEGNPAGIKAALNALSIIKNEVRLPLVKVSDSTYSNIKSITKTLID